jgi:hypothetical protein
VSEFTESVTDTNAFVSAWRWGGRGVVVVVVVDMLVLVVLVMITTEDGVELLKEIKRSQYICP